MIEFIGASTYYTTSSTLPAARPNGTVDGDFLVWVVATWTSLPTSTPSGWTLRGTVVRTSGQTELRFYTAVSKPGLPFDMVFGAAGNHMGSVLSFRGVDSNNPIDGFTPQNNTGTTTAHVAPSVNTTVRDTFVVRAIATGTTNSSGSWSWASPPTERTDSRTSAGYRYLTTATESVTDAGFVGSRSATFSTTAYFFSGTLVLRPRKMLRLGNLNKRLMLGNTEKWVA